MHSALRLCLLITLFVLCALICHANPVIGPELRICPTSSPAPGDQEGVEIAANPYGYLAVWDDTRGGDNDIFGCRLSSTGQILDPAGISISDGISDQMDPAIAWNGTEYLVVWSDRRAIVSHIYASRVRPDGQVIDKQGILLSGTSGTQAYPRVASDGRGWQVVWQDSRGGSQDIYGCRVSLDGAIGKVMGIVTVAGNNEETPDIAYNGSTFVVVWKDQRNSATTDADIYGCRVAKNGVRMAGDILVSCNSTGSSGITGAQLNPRISSCGSTNCMVVWEDYRVDVSNADIYATRLNSTMTVMDRNGIAIATGADPQELPGIGYDGIRLLVTWRNRTNRWIRGARVSTSGSLLDSSGFNVSLSAAGSAGACVCGCPNGGFEVGWNNISMSGNDALVAKVPGSGGFAGSDGTVVSMAYDTQPYYSVADNGTEYAVVWSKKVDGKSCILGARVSHSGTLINSTAVNLTAAVNGQQTQPSIAWNGTEYLVAWCGNETYDSSSLDIRGFRLDSNLAVKDTIPINIGVVSEDQTMPHVASNGSKFLVTWEDYRNAVAPNYYTDIYGAIVDASGSVTYIPSGINVSTGDQLKPCSASDGSDFYVVWEDYRAGYTQVYGVKVSSTGTVASTTGTAMPATSYSQTTPNICFGGGYYFLTWSDYSRITGCRVTPNGSITDIAGIIVDTGVTAKSCPSACWDGAKYQVVWEDYRSAFSGNADIYYTTVGSNGVVTSDPKTGLVTDLIPEYTPRIFGNSGAGVLLYSRYECYSDNLCLAQLTQLGVQEVPDISSAKTKPAGSLVVLRGKIVTAVFPDCFYIEEVTRLGAIKVLSTVGVHVGDIVDVTGVIGTCDGECQIATGSVIAMGIAAMPVGPFGMRGDTLGGVGLSAIAPGITGARGANNIGLLVKTWGKVTSIGSGYFYIESKPGTSIKVKSGTLIQPAQNKFVTVTGISACDATSGAICRAIIPRMQSDIVVLN